MSKIGTVEPWVWLASGCRSLSCVGIALVFLIGINLDLRVAGRVDEAAVWSLCAAPDKELKMCKIVSANCNMAFFNHNIPVCVISKQRHQAAQGARIMKRWLGSLIITAVPTASGFGRFVTFILRESSSIENIATYLWYAATAAECFQHTQLLSLIF